MSEPEVPILTPEEIAAAHDLEVTKNRARSALISHMSGVGASILQQYPSIEIMSWPIQRPEALVLITLGEAAVLALDDAGARTIAPYLMDVCDHHFGPPETDAARMMQLWEKAQGVIGLATLLLKITAGVNGIRARMDDRITAATTISEVHVIDSQTQGEVGALTNQYGI